MSATGTSTIGGDFSGLLGTIQTDLSEAGDWLEQEAIGGATALWAVLRVAFELVTSQQARVIIDVFARIEVDAAAGMSLEQIETDMLNIAVADEKVILEQAGSQIIQGILAFIQASQKAKAATGG